ncbi:MAG: hypothetical protein JRI94_00085 [Deltaproteobacteria bacterium]|nr:hypothetical protein [Deltaproteobacteria bacterium]MBW2031980.1 hypothetical protein [Deltaproteobacteria bacterium]
MDKSTIIDPKPPSVPLGQWSRSIIIDPKRDDLLAIFKEKKVEFYPEVGNFAYCPTKESYLTVMSAGIKREGSKAELFQSEIGALVAWDNTIRKIISGLNGKLTVFWRKMPEMRFFEPFEGNYQRWTVYSRFRISNLKIVQSANYKDVNFKEMGG